MEFNRDGLLKQIMEGLNEIAMEDGKITTDEDQFIKKIYDHVNSYLELIESALLDNIIDATEKVGIFNSRLSLIKDSVAIMREDLKITADELSLFNTLHDLIPELNQFTGSS